MISMRSKLTKSVLGYFFLHDHAEMYVNEMARRLNLDDGNLSRKLRELEKEGILKSREKGKERFYSLNANYPLLNEYKRIILKTVGIEKILREALCKFPGVERAYLFGSYAEDQMDASSDIDLIAIGKQNTVALQKKISEIQKKIDREINLISMDREEYERGQKRDPLIKRIIKSKTIRLR